MRTAALVWLLQATQETSRPGSYDNVKSISVIAESWATVLAIVVAGAWTYQLFVRQRQRFPRAVLKQDVLIRRLPIGQNLLTITAVLRNVGQTLIEVDRITVVVQQLAPLKPAHVAERIKQHDPLDPGGRREILWYRIGYRRTYFRQGQFEIEPGESDQVNFDFVISERVTAIKVDVHIENRAKRRGLTGDWWTRAGTLGETSRCIGWQCIRYCDVEERERKLVVHTTGGTDAEKPTEEREVASPL